VNNSKKRYRPSFRMLQREPAFAAGSWGSRTSKQPAFASGTSMELSCWENGVATGPSGPSVSVARK
jgi:hypothetical protein